MMIWGKILGAFFGLLLAGPLGALLGLFIGHFFDKELKFNFHQMGRDQSGRKAHAQHVFFESTFTVMGHIAKADGRISEREIKVAESIMQHMQLSNERRKLAIELFNQGKEANFDLSAAIMKLREACASEPLLLRLFFEIQVQAATADGSIQSAQQRLLENIASSLGIMWVDVNFFEQFYSQQQRQSYQHQSHTAYQPRSSLADAYTVLGVSANSSNEEIKKTYRRLMKENHPDKLIAKGLPKEMIKLATEKTQRIQIAYEQIRKARGIK